MSDVAVRIENICKQYRMGGPQASYKTIRESLVGAARAPFRRLASVTRGQLPADTSETICVLKDVSFEVKQGEVLGIIGRKRAGKNTLLKILISITALTNGTVYPCGRGGSLLEMGTGFHSEPTGRESIYLKGAILGMTRVEINRRFDKIVALCRLQSLEQSSTLTSRPSREQTTIRTSSAKYIIPSARWLILGSPTNDIGMRLFGINEPHGRSKSGCFQRSKISGMNCGERASRKCDLLVGPSRIYGRYRPACGKSIQCQ